MTTHRATVCPHDCPSACALEVELLESGRIGRVRGAAANSYTRGVVCAKVARYAERVHHPDRLTHPMLRSGPRGSGQFRRVGWEEALDRLAGAMQDATARHGAEAVWPYYFAGTMGLVQRDGINRLRHVMGYSRQDSTICSTLSEAGWRAGVGRITGPDPREMAQADLLVMWGGNPVATQVNVMTHVTRARRERGARFVVVDPYRTGTAEAADLHLALRPGTDGALACAVMHVLLREGFADRAWMAANTDLPVGLEAHLAPRGPDWASGITGLSVDEIEAFARLYGGTARSYIRLGYGLSRSRNGASNIHAVTCLPSVTGAWRHEGGGAFWHNRAIYHWDKTLIEGLDALDPGVRVIDMSRIGAALTGERSELGDGPPVQVLLVQNVNPAAVAPHSHKVRRGLMREDLFTCVHEQFLTDTARLADLVLPATTFLEHDDLYQAGAHGHIQVGPRLIAPPGECRSNHELVQALAGRLGARHPGFAMTAMEMVDATLRASGWPGAAAVLAARWVDAQPAPDDSHFRTGFGHPGGRFRFAPLWEELGPAGAAMPRLPDHWDVIDAADARHPFRLVTAPARQFLNTSFTETPGSRRREGEPTARLHPDDAARLGVLPGGRVRLGNARGEVVLAARAVEGQLPGVVVVESVWPNDAFEGGIGINALTSDERAAPMGGAVFHDTAIWVRAEPAARLAASAIVAVEPVPA